MIAEVTSGMDVVDAISVVDTDAGDVHLELRDGLGEEEFFTATFGVASHRWPVGRDRIPTRSNQAPHHTRHELRRAPGLWTAIFNDVGRPDSLTAPHHLLHDVTLQLPFVCQFS